MVTLSRALEDLMKKKLNAAPSLRTQARAQAGRAARPPVAAPSLDDLSIEVPLPPPPDDDELALLVECARRMSAMVTARPRGQAIADDDALLVDLVGYVCGEVMPLTVRRGVTLDADTDIALPGLRAALAASGVAVGGSRVVAVTLPGHDALPGVLDEYAGLTVTYAVDVRGADIVELPAIDDQSFLASIGATSADDVVERVAAIAADDAAAALDELVQTAILDELAERVDVAISEEEIEEVVRARFRDGEGALLVAKGVSLDKQQSALEHKLLDPRVRDEAERDLRVSFALGALQAELDVQLDASDLDAMVAEMSTAFETSVDRIKAMLRASPELVQRLTEALLLDRTIASVVRAAVVHYQDAI